uniref:Serine-threonine/tyrosine-protein kinase catalytic domain-containing protein n=1 Tax=Panagrolaimus sp. JU765 TaxID=591449 RepID=A0AC34Q1Q2_9BILA
MENKRSNTHRKWLLIFLDQDKSFNKVEITYWRRDFVLKEEKSVKMLDFIGQKGLKMIPRPIFVKKDQIIDRTLKTGNLSSPIHDHLFMLGKMCSKILLLDENRKMPVFAVDCSKYKPKIQKALFEEAKKMLHFGSIRIWRLLAISKENHGLILVFEDIVHGSLMDHVRQQKRNDSELKKFALQMAEGLRYLEKFNFIHHPELVSTDDGHDELDKCRWTAPECLFSVSHEPTEKYDLISMVFTFGNCLFSMFHGGFLPFEDESSQNIKNREWRMKNFPIPEIELMPKEIIESRGRRKLFLTICRKWGSDRFFSAFFPTTANFTRMRLKEILHISDVVYASIVVYAFKKECEKERDRLC